MVAKHVERRSPDRFATANRIAGRRGKARAKRDHQQYRSDGDKQPDPMPNFFPKINRSANHQSNRRASGQGRDHPSENDPRSDRYLSWSDPSRANAGQGHEPDSPLQIKSKVVGMGECTDRSAHATDRDRRAISYELPERQN